MIFETFFLFLFLFLSNSEYNSKLALESWIYSSAAYCDPSRLQKWNVSYYSELFPFVTDIEIFENDLKYNNLGYIGYNPNTNVVFMSFRGTQASAANWWENFNVFKTTYPKCQNCEVHTGFLTAYSTFKNTIIPKLATLKKKYPYAQTLLTGHSLGGAMATLAIPDLFEEIDGIDFFYSFGSPRVGNSDFANFINDFFLKGGYSARVTHNQDLVPHLPEKFLGYKHIDNEVYYDEKSQDFSICQNDEKGCSNENLMNPSIQDHKNYMGVPTSYSKFCRNG